MAEEGYSFDPSNKKAYQASTTSHAKATNKNINLSLDEVVAQKRKEQMEERKNRIRTGDIRFRGRTLSSPRIKSLASRERGDTRARRTSRVFEQRQSRKSSADIEKIRSLNENTERETNRSSRASNQQKVKPRQIEVPEESLRKFLRGEGIKMDKNFTYKIMSYPKE